MRTIKILLFMITFFGLPLILNNFVINNAILSERENQLGNPIKLNPSADNENFTVKVSFPKLIWIEGNLNIEIELNSKLEGKIKCLVVDSKGGKYFTNVKVTEDLTSLEKDFHLTTKPHLSTLPGKYLINLVITYIDENEKSEQIYTNEYEVILGTGYLILYCILIVFGAAMIVVLTRVADEEEKKAAKKTSQPITSLPDNKIQCPKCQKIIDEGLAFCPECGERIPEFLQFNPTSTGL